MELEYTHEYDVNYDGPALPVVEIQVNAFNESGIVLTKRALVDSGADATIIPLSDLEKMSARKVDTRRLRVIGGVSYRVDIYEVALALGPYRVPKIFAVADRQNRDVILGRDVLNQFTTTLDGLAYMVHISQ